MRRNEKGRNTSGQLLYSKLESVILTVGHYTVTVLPLTCAYFFLFEGLIISKNKLEIISTDEVCT